MRSYKLLCHSRKFLSGILTLILLINAIGPIPQAQADEFRLPTPGVMVPLSPEFNPLILKGIKVHPDNPFRFDFILDQGSEQLSSANAVNYLSSPKAVNYLSSPKASVGDLKQESTKLIKYFLASLTIPEKDLWVNLSPYEKTRIIPQSFGLTEMGRDLLAEDYMLKQITASLIYPEDRIGKTFWRRIYIEAQKRFGTTNIPVNTFNKVWIVPDKAVVYENAKAGTAYVVESKLKVMLEQDYLSLERNTDILRNSVILSTAKDLNKINSIRDFSAKPQNDINVRYEMAAVGANIIREIVIPALTSEVNEGQNFAELRQVYNSLILATWYKKKIRDSILEQVYADKNKVVGVQYNQSVVLKNTVILSVAKDLNKFKDSSATPKNDDAELIYQQYLRAFKKGVYNYIKEDVDPLTQETVPRKYFSGGMNFAMLSTPLGLKGMGALFKTVSAFKLPLAKTSLLLASVNITPDDVYNALPSLTLVVAYALISMNWKNKTKKRLISPLVTFISLMLIHFGLTLFYNYHLKEAIQKNKELERIQQFQQLAQESSATYFSPQRMTEEFRKYEENLRFSETFSYISGNNATPVVTHNPQQEIERKTKWVTSPEAKELLDRFSLMNQPKLADDPSKENIPKKEKYQGLARKFIFYEADRDKSEDGSHFFERLKYYKEWNMISIITLPPAIRDELYKNRENHEMQKIGNAINDSRPLAIVIRGESDWDGAFLDDGSTREIPGHGSQTKIIPSFISKGYRVLTTDAKDWSGVEKAVLDFTQFQRAILFLEDHGAQHRMEDFVDTEKDTLQEPAPSFFNGLFRGWLGDGEIALRGRVDEVFLRSCSTGRGKENIVDWVSRVFGARTYGPMDDEGFEIFNPDKQGADRVQFFDLSDPGKPRFVNTYFSDPALVSDKSIKASAVNAAMQTSVPEYPDQSPSLNPEVDTKVQQSVLDLRGVFSQVSGNAKDWKAYQTVALDAHHRGILIEGFKAFVIRLTNDEDYLERTIRELEVKLGDRNQWALSQWEVLGRLLFLNLNLRLLVKNGWVIEIANDHNLQLILKIAKIKKYRIIDDHEAPIILVEFQKVNINNLILPSDFFAGFSRPNYIYFNYDKMGDSNLSKDYAYVLERQKEPKIFSSKTARTILGRLKHVGVDRYCTILKGMILLEEWTHFQDYLKIQTGDSEHDQVRAIFNNDNDSDFARNVKDFWLSSQQEAYYSPEVYLMTALEINALLKRLSSVDSADRLEVELVEIVANTFDAARVTRDNQYVTGTPNVLACHIVLQALNQAVKGQAIHITNNYAQTEFDGLEKLPKDLLVDIKNIFGKSDVIDPAMHSSEPAESASKLEVRYLDYPDAIVGRSSGDNVARAVMVNVDTREYRPFSAYKSRIRKGQEKLAQFKRDHEIPDAKNYAVGAPIEIIVGGEQFILICKKSGKRKDFAIDSESFDRIAFLEKWEMFDQDQKARNQQLDEVLDSDVVFSTEGFDAEIVNGQGIWREFRKLHQLDDPENYPEEYKDIIVDGKTFKLIRKRVPGKKHIVFTLNRDIFRDVLASSHKEWKLKNKKLDVQDLTLEALAHELNEFFRHQGLMGRLRTQGVGRCAMYMIKGHNPLSLLVVLDSDNSLTDLLVFRNEMQKFLAKAGVESELSVKGTHIISVGKNSQYEKASRSTSGFFSILRKYNITGNQQQGIAEIRFVQNTPGNSEIINSVLDGVLVFKEQGDIAYYLKNGEKHSRYDGLRIQKLENNPAMRGGIDLTLAKDVLQDKNTDGVIKFHLDPAMLAQLQNVSGFVPVITKIQPLGDLRKFLGLPV